jgi:hypothetical protein
VPVVRQGFAGIEIRARHERIVARQVCATLRSR